MGLDGWGFGGAGVGRCFEGMIGGMDDGIVVERSDVGLVWGVLGRGKGGWTWRRFRERVVVCSAWCGVAGRKFSSKLGLGFGGMMSGRSGSETTAGERWRRLGNDR